MNHDCIRNPSRRAAAGRGAALAMILAGLPAAAAQDWLSKPYATERTRFARAYDSTRDRIVVFGGRAPDSTARGDTLEWNGTRWTQRFPANAPTARISAAMVYDAARQVTVLFGGAGSDETWEWDGVDWTQRLPASRPTPRGGHAMAYDPDRQVVVLFGGDDQGTTWEWNGTDWLQRTPTTSPGGRSRHAMAYDAARQVTVLFGGSDRQTWEWDGSDWTQRTPADRPRARAGVAMAYDAARQRVVLFGGVLDGSTQTLDEVWEWDGSDWTQVVPDGGPQPRSDHGVVYDTARQRIVTFFGEGSAAVLATTWAWDGSDWTALDAGAPAPRRYHAAAYDVARDTTVMFGGGAGQLGDTWEWNGAAWQLRTSTGPPQRWRHAMAYDEVRQEALIYGGSTGTTRTSRTAMADTWTWDGVEWTLRAQGTPLAREGAAAVWVPGRNRILLFGGGSYGTEYDKTWEWDGSSWTQLSPATAPPGRKLHAMVYDAARGRVVLFGGYESGKSSFGYEYETVYSDTWEWDGATWIRRSPATVPTRRFGHAMVYDADRQRVVMFGGFQNLRTPHGDTWEWDGSNWIRIAPEVQPRSRGGTAAVYDRRFQRTVPFGGLATTTSSGLLTNDTWVYGPTRAAQATPIGTGCGGPAGAPLLDGFGTPQVGNASFALDLVGAQPLAPAALMLSGGPAALPIGGGCSLWIDPNLLVLTLPASTNGGGFASIPIPIPLEPATIGADLYGQAVVIDPAGPFLGLSLTRGVRVLVGE